MKDEMDKIKKKIKKEFNKIVQVDPDSDLPVHEKYTKQKKIRSADEDDDDEGEEE